MLPAKLFKLMSRLFRRAERVKQMTRMGRLLQEYGYTVMDDDRREQQFACDLHGLDNKPSARLYGHTNSFHCFACAKSRDVIEFVRDKEQVGFKVAVELLEQRLQLPPMVWEDEDNYEDPQDQTEREIDAIAAKAESYEEALARLQKFLDTLTKDRDLDADSLLKFWEVFDRIAYYVEHDQWDEARGIMGLSVLRRQMFERLKPHG